MIGSSNCWAFTQKLNFRPFFSTVPSLRIRSSHHPDEIYRQITDACYKAMDCDEPL